MIVIACDPGSEHSSLVMWDGTAVLFHVDEPNEAAIQRIRGWLDTPRGMAVEEGVRLDLNSVLVIEQIESFGMAVGKSTFETVYWSGRFAEAWFPKRVERLPRKAIKLHLCGQSRATDSNIRQAIIDRFGPSTDKAVGTKKHQGPLYGITGHKMSALAVALTWADQNAGADGEPIRPGVTADF